MKALVHLVDPKQHSDYLLYAKCGAEMRQLPKTWERIDCPRCLALMRLEDQHQQDLTGPRR